MLIRLVSNPLTILSMNLVMAERDHGLMDLCMEYLSIDPTK